MTRRAWLLIGVTTSALMLGGCGGDSGGDPTIDEVPELLAESLCEAFLRHWVRLQIGIDAGDADSLHPELLERLEHASARLLGRLQERGTGLVSRGFFISLIGKDRTERGIAAAHRAPHADLTELRRAGRRTRRLRSSRSPASRRSTCRNRNSRALNACRCELVDACSCTTR